jgi:2-polyprenyl-3-methyl-5-hydroxy-6-metoxy-1,4-benzoquinol methylase
MGYACVDTPEDGHGVRPVALSGQVSAVTIVADQFLIAGDLDGSLALFDISRLDRPLDGMTLPGGIWNLSSDSAAGRVYVACGDGHLYALELSPDAALSRERVEDLRDAVTSRPLTIEKLLGSTASASEVSVALAEIDAEWNDYSRSDIDGLTAALKRWSTEHPSARLSYRLGIAELECGRWDDAIVALQQVDQTSDSYVASLLPLAEAFDHIGSPRTAINVLKANLKRFPAPALLDVLFRIGQLSEKARDIDGALTAYEAVSYQDHSYPGVRAALARLHPGEIPALAEPQGAPVISYPVGFADAAPKVPRLGSRRQLGYDEISYIQYQYGPPADEAKKILEEHVMAGVLARLFPEPGRSLDIGCATGRWPIWFSRRGWDATGYDIASPAIKICELQAQKMPSEHRPAFSLYNICDGAREVAAFDLVSTMMGTFNHVPHTQLASFLQGIWDSLVPRGALVFTSWNTQSRFCDFLNLDGEPAKEDLRRNYLEATEIAAHLEHAGFAEISTSPIVFLPNECYDVWGDDLDNPVESIVELDDVLRQHVGANKAQMHFYVTRKAQS